ncbi:hypothetical protein AGMMS50293_16420 [Spirochaetia bacterium]|nr:hypothetical protein AGMMS50293_16420 [Spirochaetia bacterium]
MAEVQPVPAKTVVEFVSFGFKYGEEFGDLVFNARFLPNPYYIDSLKLLTGRDTACADYVFSFQAARETLQSLKELVLIMAVAFQEQGREALKICIGCTGGQHRSVALIEKLAKETAILGYPVLVRHREMEAGRY